MGRFRLFNVISLCAVCALIFISCAEKESIYTGAIDFMQHSHLKDKKIFIDPGHGAAGDTDGRKGPTGLKEEDVNLKVGKILASMCTLAGAEVKMSRTEDVDISLDDRAKMVIDYEPDLFICIHHNGNPRPKDKVNYPSILIWGNKDENPASYDLAQLTLTEFDKLFEHKGIIASDYAVFRETGAKVLRETRAVCPGILGEFGFFSDKDMETHLRDEAFNVKEAEAYFASLSEYFKRGVPTAAVLVDQRAPSPEDGTLGPKNRTPVIRIKVDSGMDKPGIAPGSLKVTLNDLSVPAAKISNTEYAVNYGSIFAGGHKLRFSFRNPRSQSSMVYYASMAVPFAQGEYRANYDAGKSLIDSGRAHEGLQRLLPALYAGFSDPLSDDITYQIARRFEKIGDRSMAAYYYSSLWEFYPGSSFRNSVPPQYRLRHVPADYYGKKAKWEKIR
ncbi:MAG: N-acetylmuramoyl-L-alanine amidase family protein [Spirochaetota bacterium]